MDYVPYLLGFAVGLLAGMVIYDFLMAPRIRRRALEQAKKDLAKEFPGRAPDPKPARGEGARRKGAVAPAPDPEPEPEPVPEPAVEEAEPEPVLAELEPVAAEEIELPVEEEAPAPAEEAALAAPEPEAEPDLVEAPAVEAPAEAAEEPDVLDVAPEPVAEPLAEIPPEPEPFAFGDLEAASWSELHAELGAEAVEVSAGAVEADPPPEPPPAEPPAATILLLLVRHGEADKAKSDAERPLTPAGRRAVRMLSAELHSREFSPVAIRTSPLRRARQTAETIFSALPHPGPVETTPELGPSGGVGALLGLLQREAAGSTVCWVGHMPDLGALAGRLLGEEGDVVFKPGSAVALRVDPHAEAPAATLEWGWDP